MFDSDGAGVLSNVPDHPEFFMQGMRVYVYSPKGRKFRGMATVANIEHEQLAFHGPLLFKIRRGDRITLAPTIGYRATLATIYLKGLERH